MVNRTIIFILLCQKFGYVHLSAGDLLREERRRPNSEVGQLIEKHIREGSIVPVEITCSLLEKVSHVFESVFTVFMHVHWFLVVNKPFYVS